MKKVFLSYSYNNNKAYETFQYLQKKLPNLNIEVISIKDSIRMGENWKMSITDQIEKCSIFICFIERENPNVMFELGYALAKNKKLILIGDFKDLPFDLMNMTYIKDDAQPYEILMRIENYFLNESEINNKIIDLSSVEKLKLMLDRIDILNNMDGSEFEKFVGDWFEYHKFEVVYENQRRNLGYDLKLSKFRDSSAIVEVKKYKTSSQVPMSVVRQLVGTMSLEHIEYGIIISTAPFSRSVEYFVKEIEPTILLWTLEDLHKLSDKSTSFIEIYEK